MARERRKRIVNTDRIRVACKRPHRRYYYHSLGMCVGYLPMRARTVFVEILLFLLAYNF